MSGRRISDFIDGYKAIQQPQVKVRKFDRKAKTWTLEIKKYGNSKPGN